MTKCFLTFAIAALIFAGCASDDDSAPVSEVPTVPTAAPTTAAPAPTTAAPTTAAPTTAAPTTAAPVPTTTAAPEEDSVVDVAAGVRHSCALYASGTVWCWGENAKGQLGNGEQSSNAYSTVPVRVLGIDDAVAIAAGWEHSCAVHGTGEVSCWGDDTNGELGDGEIRDFQATPSKVVSINDAVSVSAGHWHTCALHESGRASCWGSDHDGQLGNGSVGDEFDSAVPVEVVDISDAVAVSAGGEHTCALHSSGEVSCWGDNWRGELGDGRAGIEFDSGVPVKVSGVSDAVALAAGDFSTCAVRESGGVSCWGTNAYGDLGTGQGNELPFSATPLNVFGVNDVISASTGGSYTCALHEGGNISCWGVNNFGQLGTSSVETPFSTLPIAIRHIDDATRIAAGSGHVCVIRESGGVHCWGANYHGQLGIGADSGVSYERVQVVGIDDAISVSAAGRHTCATHETGEISCWGRGWKGASGEAATGPAPPLPVKISGITTATGVDANIGVSCAVLQSGEASCWGAYRLSNFVAADNGDISPVPTPWTDTPDITSIEAGGFHACALHEDGTITCAGANWYGNLGNGEYGTSISWTPTQVVGIDDAVDIAAGFSHGCAVHATGEVSCWGSNDDGQLGNGTQGYTSGSPSPLKVSGITDAVSVDSSHSSLTCVLHATGEVSCWGGNYLAELGNSTTSDGLHSPTDHSSVPVKSGGITDATSVSVGNTHVCVVHESGEVSCWGFNGFGELGTEEQISDDQTPTPIKLDGLSPVQAVSAGLLHTCALHVDGTITCWGFNEFGQLGSGKTFVETGSHLPVRVSGT